MWKFEPKVRPTFEQVHSRLEQLFKQEPEYETAIQLDKSIETTYIRSGSLKPHYEKSMV